MYEAVKINKIHEPVCKKCIYWFIFVLIILKKCDYGKK